MSIAILVPVIVFTTFISALALIVLGARAWLAPTGTRSVTVNRDRRVDVAAGDRLLWALAEHGMLLPAACGGRGSCGQCRVVVTRGGGSALPNERALLSRSELDAGMRLSCMLTVREDLEVSIAPDRLAARKRVATVRGNRNVAPFLTQLTLELPGEAPLDFDAGGYVLIEAPPGVVAFSAFEIDAAFREDWQRHGYLDLTSESDVPVTRAYSLANAPAEGPRQAVLLVRIALPPPGAAPGTPPGRVSSFIFNLRPGDTVQVAGPYGSFHASETDRDMVMLAGGVGIAPIRSIIVDQLMRETQRTITLWYGARDERDLCFAEEFDRLAREHANFRWHAVFSSPRGDSRRGYVGLVHNVVMSEFLEQHPGLDELDYYLCGPPLMSSAVLDMLDDLGIDRERIYFDDFGNG